MLRSSAWRQFHGIRFSRRQKAEACMRIVRALISAVLVAAVLVGGIAAAANRDEHIDPRHGHNQSYINRGVIVDRMPREAVIVHNGPNRYWFHGGVWYRPEGNRFVVIAPPVGVFVPVLPPFYTALMIG